MFFFFFNHTENKTILVCENNENNNWMINIKKNKKKCYKVEYNNTLIRQHLRQNPQNNLQFK